ncbi:MAG: type II secretion system secretin GspD [Bdellovibrionia bacterium]
MKLKKHVSLGLATVMASQVSSAQFENFPPPPPPIPDMGTEENSGFSTPPPPDFGNNGFGGGSDFAAPTNSAAPSAAANAGPLSKEKKQKFSQAGLEDITDKNFPETIESFDFPNVEISDLVKAVGEMTGKNFIIDPGVRGKITIIAPSKITVAEAYKAFLSALAINGYTVVPSGSFLKVKSARNAQRDSIETYSGAYYPNSDQMITRIIHLKHISAEQVNRDLRILSSKDGEMSVYTPTNSIILSDFGSNVDRVMKILSQLDVPGFEEQLEVIPIKFAKAKDLADLVDKIVNKGQGGGSNSTASRAGGTFSAGVPRFTRTTTTTNQQGTSYFMAFPDDRTNSIIAVGNKAGIDRLKRLISQLDFRIRPEDSGGVYVYYVKHGEAEKIAQTLNGVAKESAPKPTTGGSLLSPIGSGGAMTAPQEVFGGDVKIVADKNTNSLIVTASKQDYDVVMSLLSKIDIPRDQVFVEAIIMEMSANDTMNYNAGYYQYPSGGYGKAGFNGGINLQEMLSPTGGQGAVLGFGGGKTVTVTDPLTGKSLSIPSLTGFINFLKTVRKANVLSTPQLMALDNQEAEIKVGDRVAVGSTQNQTANGNSTFTPNFEDAAIEMTIKPFISPGSDSIRMEIKQSVKQLSNVPVPKALADTTQPLATRMIKTNIVVRNGDTAILGGLIKEQETEAVSKVPLLGDIPILGWLFKSRSTLKDKVNMLVFLTPKIIRNPADQNGVINKKLGQRLDFIKSHGGRDPYGKHLEEVARQSGFANETDDTSKSR